MPQINLLKPLTGKKAKKVKEAKEIPKIELTQVSKKIFPLFGLTAFIMLCLCLIMGIQIISKSRTLKIILEKEKKFSINPQELTKLRYIKEALEERLTFIEDLIFRKFLWSEKLQEISEIIPFGVWLTNISLEKIKIKTDGSKDGLEKLVFVIKGKAVAPQIQDAIDLIGKFNTLLKEDKSFSKDFSDIELKAVSKDAIAKTDVMSFEFTCSLK